jgi:hypothetical protein
LFKNQQKDEEVKSKGKKTFSINQGLRIGEDEEPECLSPQFNARVDKREFTFSTFRRNHSKERAMESKKSRINRAAVNKSLMNSKLKKYREQAKKLCSIDLSNMSSMVIKSPVRQFEVSNKSIESLGKVS